MYTAQHVRAAIEGFERAGGESWPFVKSLIVDLYTGLDKYRQVLQILAKESKDIREMLAAVGRVAPTEGAISEAPVAAPSVGADGSPIDATQAAAEAAMDAAAGPHPMSSAAQSRAPKRGNGGGRRPPQAAPEIRIGADGTPMTPEESAIEAQMDAAIDGA